MFRNIQNIQIKKKKKKENKILLSRFDFPHTISVCQHLALNEKRAFGSPRTLMQQNSFSQRPRVQHVRTPLFPPFSLTPYEAGAPVLWSF